MGLYAIARGHRLIILSPHNRAWSRGGRTASGTATPGRSRSTAGVLGTLDELAT